MYTLAYNLIWWNSQFSIPSRGLGIRGQLAFLERPSANKQVTDLVRCPGSLYVVHCPRQLGNAAPLPVAAASFSHCSQDSRSLPGTHSLCPAFKSPLGKTFLALLCLYPTITGPT